MNSGLYVESKNTGLPSNFSLANGKFQLVGGERKAENSLVVMLHFMVWFRFFLSDFIPDVLWIYQKNSSIIKRFKNIFRLQFLRAANKYAPFAEIKGIDVPINMAAKKDILIDINFRYRLDKTSNFKPVRFLIAS